MADHILLSQSPSKSTPSDTELWRAALAELYPDRLLEELTMADLSAVLRLAQRRKKAMKEAD